MSKTRFHLSVSDHRRDSAGLTYVYPVVSRRGGGVSVGINLNTNNACNWRCIYCQVPGLQRGSAPPVNLALLENELRGLLNEIVHGNFLLEHVPAEARRLTDIALSGNGEPTSAAEFEQVVALAGQVMADFGLTGRIRLTLISNGSLMHRPGVRRGLQKMAQLNGEVWFKLDRATATGRAQINHSRQSPENALMNLSISANLCPTWIQSAVFTLDGQTLAHEERQAYLDLLRQCGKESIPLRGVMLYGLARPSLQPEAPRLGEAPRTWIESFVAEIQALGLSVKLDA